jgi:hypothetical protein
MLARLNRSKRCSACSEKHSCRTHNFQWVAPPGIGLVWNSPMIRSYLRKASGVGLKYPESTLRDGQCFTGQVVHRSSMRLNALSYHQRGRIWDASLESIKWKNHKDEHYFSAGPERCRWYKNVLWSRTKHYHLEHSSPTQPLLHLSKAIQPSKTQSSSRLITLPT